MPKVSTGLHDVIGDEDLAPEKAPMVALCRVMGQEDHDLRCASIDVELFDHDLDRQADRLLADLAREDPDPVLAYRRGRRWVQDFERLPPFVHEGPRAPVREGGVYLITGGLGNVGFIAGVALARQPRAKGLS